ncbi:hypothetical protein CEXT_336351 [Caerostris extrusa]|uniref:Uncharacterized protein n=1 Tax=Caerostris extrusa TaxID=172846 RepID=A0AAV4UYN7_CAEEX|nr:hypothetical protein CEXT_336351 [Caerostris extrusa]
MTYTGCNFIILAFCQLESDYRTQTFTVPFAFVQTRAAYIYEQWRMGSVIKILRYGEGTRFRIQLGFLRNWFEEGKVFSASFFAHTRTIWIRDAS